MEQRTCQGCPATIEPGTRERNKRKWCSEACRVNTHRERTGYTPPPKPAAPIRVSETPCPYCGGQMVGRQTRSCGSVECGRAYNRDRCREYNRQQSGFYEPKQTSQCEGCAAEFAPRKGFGHVKRFCSLKCKRRNDHATQRASSRALRGGKGWTQRRAEAIIAKAARGTSSDAVWVNGTCHECGQPFTRHGMASPYCSKACSTKVRRRARRALTRTHVGAHAIHERDNWTCHICGDPVNRTAKVPALDAPTLDHVIALARGGAHDASNMKTAHFYCNAVKRDLALEDVA